MSLTDLPKDKPGVFLFCLQDTYSKLLRLIHKTEWSHVGLYYPIKDQGYWSQYYSLNSNTSSIEDVKLIDLVSHPLVSRMKLIALNISLNKFQFDMSKLNYRRSGMEILTQLSSLLCLSITNEFKFSKVDKVIELKVTSNDFQLDECLKVDKANNDKIQALKAEFFNKFQNDNDFASNYLTRQDVLKGHNTHYINSLEILTKALSEYKVANVNQSVKTINNQRQLLGLEALEVKTQTPSFIKDFKDMLKSNSVVALSKLKAIYNQLALIYDQDLIADDNKDETLLLTDKADVKYYDLDETKLETYTKQQLQDIIQVLDTTGQQPQLLDKLIDELAHRSS